MISTEHPPALAFSLSHSPPSHECLLTCGFLGYLVWSIASHRSDELSWGLASSSASSDTITKPRERKWANVGEKGPEKCYSRYVSRLRKQSRNQLQFPLVEF